MPAFVALARAGFRRHASYRQATAASAFTNTVFGFLKCYVLLAALDAVSGIGGTGTIAGYDAGELATFVWVGQGLVGVVQLFSWTELADRIRSGDVAADLLRPVDPQVAYLAADLGRAGHAALTRLVVPVTVGALFFPLDLPERPVTYLLTVASVALGVVVSFGARYLANLAAFWWLDARGANTVWLICSTMLSGLAVPVAFFPEWARLVVWAATPFPWMFQAPLDILLERGGGGHQAVLLAGQLVAAVAVLVAGRVVQRAAVRTLVVQGG